jgi:type VI secretion system protein ImpC
MAQEALEQASVATADAVSVDDFALLLQKEFKPNSDAKQSRIEEAIKTLAQQALEDAQIIGDDVFTTVDALKAAIDRKLTEQVNQVLHHKDFQTLESAWKGLWHSSSRLFAVEP